MRLTALHLWWTIALSLAVGWVLIAVFTLGRWPLETADLLGVSSLGGAVFLTALSRGGPGEAQDVFCRSFGPAQALTDRVRKWFKVKIDSGAQIRDPESAASSFTFNLFASVFVSVPFAVTTAFVTPLTFAALAIIAAPLASLELALLDKVRERKERANDELPFFTSLATVMTHAGMTLYDVFVSIARFPELFRQMSYEGRLLRRNVEILGYGPVEAMEAQAYSHPSEQFNRVVMGTTSVWRAGGDVPTTLENRAEELMKETQIRWEGYAEKASAIGQILTVVFLLTGISVIVVAIAFPSMALRLLDLAAVSVIPVSTILSYALLRKEMPRKQDVYDFSCRKFSFIMVTVAASAVLLSFIGLPTAPVFASSILVLSVAVYLLMRRQVMEVRGAEKALQRFLRDITELRKGGVQLPDAISRVAKKGGYNKTFDRSLRGVAARIGLGRSIYQAAERMRSWLTRMTFYLAKEIDETGGGKPSLLEKVMDLLRVFELSWRRAVSGLGIYVMLAYLTPVILVLTAAAIAALWSGVAAGVPTMRFGGLSLATAAELNAVAAASMLIAAESTAAYSWLVGNALDGHAYGTWRVAVGMVIFLVMFFLYPTLTGLFAELFRPAMGPIGVVPIP